MQTAQMKPSLELESKTMWLGFTKAMSRTQVGGIQLQIP